MKIWDKIMDFAENIYVLTKKFPNEEHYVLVPQLRRASISVASNLAEGSARKTKNDTVYFYSLSKASLSEIDAQLEIAFRLGYIKNDEYAENQNKVDEISGMLQGLINSYKKTLA